MFIIIFGLARNKEIYGPAQTELSGYICEPTFLAWAFELEVRLVPPLASFLFLIILAMYSSYVSKKLFNDFLV